jgi:c-di-GMP-binding flagellar brake protein YcgR
MENSCLKGEASDSRVMESSHQDFQNDIESHLTANELLKVHVANDPNPVLYVTRIHNMSKGRLVIAWPTTSGVRLLARRNQILSFYFVREGAAYTFTGLVDETNSKALPQITVIINSTVKRIQRRQNFRIKSLIPVEIVASVKESPRDKSASILVIRTTTYDLGADGIAIRNAHKLPEGTLLEIKLALPDNRPAIKIPCRIVYSDNIGENPAMNHIGIHFLAISERERARIVRYLYRSQLKGLRS